MSKPAPNATLIAQTYLDSFQAALTSKNVPALVALFREDGWWRDILNIDEADMNSLRKPQIAGHMEMFGVPGLTNMKVDHGAEIVIVNPQVTWVQAYTSYETEIGRGKGFIRLIETDGVWLAYTFFTALWEIKGHEEFINERRPLGANHTTNKVKTNWLDERKATIEFADEDPTVLIVGGGQNGIMLAARLTVLGIKTLIVEKHKRVGDSWRLRYHSLALHDPIFADESFPRSWPVFLPKDKLAHWFEAYSEIMELNIWLNSTIESGATFDDATMKWSVNVVRDGHPVRNMQISHLVLASGFSGEARIPDFAKNSIFEGDLMHSSRFPGADAYVGKKAVVIGACNSSHDICSAFFSADADVTMIQRSSTYVMSSEHGLKELLAGVYEERAPPIEDADLMLTSLPIDLLAEFHVGATKSIAIKDKVILDGLKVVGFKFNPYPAGLFIKYFREGGGYYIDIGASTLLAEGKIKIKQGREIVKLTKDGVLFDDGVELKADVVVCATGYSSIRDTVRRVISDDVADRLGSVWGEDAQGEIPGVWRHSGVPRFTLSVGNMFQARCFSKHIALQIQMIELGLVKDPVFPAYKARANPNF